MKLVLRRLWHTAVFAAESFGLTAILACVLVGASCFRHGDRGPYPETEYLPLVPVVAMLIVYAARGPARDG